MMTDEEFSELQLRATIVPEQARWPAPEYTHWQALHRAANEARARVGKAYMEMDEIDQNADLSGDDKYHQRSETAAQAIADFEASKTLARAYQAVELLAVKRNSGGHISPEITQDREALLKAAKEAEAGWQRALDKIAERAGLTKSPGIRR